MNNVVRPDADFIRSHTEKANKLLLEANYSKKSQHFSKAVEVSKHILYYPWFIRKIITNNIYKLSLHKQKFYFLKVICKKK